MNCNSRQDYDCCDRDGNFDNLCAKCAKIKDIKCEKVWADEVKGNRIHAKHLNAENQVANDICAQSVTAVASYSENSFTNSLCAQTANIDSLCVNNLQVANPARQCIQYRATAVLSKNTVYSLGTDILWDTVLDDANANFALGKYTAPKTGYYSLSAHIEMSGFTSASQILGVPVAELEIYVNGLLFRESYFPFVSFNPAQSSLLSSLVLLNAGDVVSVRVDIATVDPVNGVTNIVGTVVLSGNGLFANNSSFGIILLSELCSPAAAAQCPPCPIVQVMCSPISVSPSGDNMCADMNTGSNSGSVSLSSPAASAPMACAPCVAPMASNLSRRR